MKFLFALPQRLLMGLVRAYQLLFSAWIGNVCCYYPSCSHYALGALRRHGAWGGSALAAWRVLRCNPWSLGGDDPVPEHAPWRGLFTRLLPADTVSAGTTSSESKKFP
jgi:putative membrane protein insertion efficiency factor